ncbi:hypothetical protein LCGC14_2788030 [marine sediment metagenome]|uniref:Uncharacterized protein n=1 Tax=marine sediment metagenome TaxID=412755 RepID=A0A0F8YRF0_9ZZZZ
MRSIEELEKEIEEKIKTFESEKDSQCSFCGSYKKNLKIDIDELKVQKVTLEEVSELINEFPNYKNDQGWTEKIKRELKDIIRNTKQRGTNNG